MKLFLGGLIVSLGLWTLPAQAQVSSAQVNALVEAIRQAAPQTGTSQDGLYSDWQVQPGNIPRWAKFCTGREVTPEQFGANANTARTIITCIIKDALQDEYPASGNSEAIAVQRVAAWWMTGDSTRYTNAATSPYTNKVLSLYQKLKSPNAASRPAAVSRNAASTATSTSASATPANAASPASQNEYERYMQAGYAATKKGDYPSALLNFKRAVDERPNDTYAQKAVQNVEGYLTRSRSGSAPTNQNSAQPPATQPARNQNGSSPKTSGVVVPTQTGAANNAALSQNQAVGLITEWLAAKSRIFAPPFDRQPVQQFTTGELYGSLVRDDGAIAWLKDNQAYYRFGVQKVESVERFVADQNKATVELKITEDRTLYRDGKVDPSQTDFQTRLVRYSLESIDGAWKIADYKTVDGSVLERAVGTNAQDN
ncbi:ARC6/PARC6 family protein [Trichocoleus desertorum AS-A10]|uniref:ARC6/PARC6 family protein n=1 Tax=Trichocoleus desertorum TaxID=1481672 RepID=UPI003296D75E